MKPIKLKPWLVWCLCVGSLTASAQLVMNRQGKIIAFDSAVKTSTATLQGQLDTISTKKTAIESFHATLQGNYKAAKELIAKPAYNAFLKRYLNSGKYNAFNSGFNPSDTATNPVLVELHKNPIQYHYKSSTNSIVKTDLLNHAYLNVYNNLYNTQFASGGTPILNDDELKSIRITLKSYHDTIAGFKSKMEKSPDFFDVALYSDIYKYLEHFNTLFTDPSSDIGKVKTVLNSNWVASWLWLKKGKMSLNPYDLATSDFYIAHPEYDVNKAEIYNQFIKKSITKITDSARFKDLDDLKKALNELEKGKEIFLDSRNKEAQADYEKQLKTLTTTSVVLTVLNKSLLSPTSKTYYLDVDSDPDTDVGFLKDPARVDEDKARKILVYNAIVDDKFNVVQKSTAIEDKSRFQVGLDSVVGRVSQLAGLIATFTPFNSLLSPFRLQNNGTIKTTAGNNAFTARDRAKTAVDTLNNYYVAAAITNKNITNNLMAREEIKKIKAATVKSMEEHVFDSKNLMEIFFTFATIPTGTLSGQSDTAPSYTSVPLSIKIPDKVTSNQVEITRINAKKDTTTLREFDYRAGKLHRFQVSAGLLYTAFSNQAQFRQTTVVENEGRIEVKNETQPFTFFVALHTYPFKKGLFIQDDKIETKYWLSRIGIVTGLGISKNPLDNFYVGGSYDVVPGLKVNALCRFYRNDDVVIRNDKIVDRYIRYRPAFSVGLSIDPLSLTKTLTSLTKK